MQRVVFLDSNILLNVLNVPGKNGERQKVEPTFRDLVSSAGGADARPARRVAARSTHPRAKAKP